jgi:hypothetical protein
MKRGREEEKGEGFQVLSTKKQRRGKKKKWKRKWRA